MNNVIRFFCVNGVDKEGFFCIGYFRGRDKEEAENKALRAWVKNYAKVGLFYKPEDGDIKITRCVPVERVSETTGGIFGSSGAKGL